MDRAEFRVLRESLGLLGSEVAAAAGVGARAVRRWEQGGSEIGDEYADVLRSIAESTQAYTDSMTARVAGMRDPRVVTYDSDEGFQATKPGVPWSARWHRMVAARVARNVPGAAVVYAEDS